MDSISNLKKYIEKNLIDKDGGNWEYIYRPEIRYMIDLLNEREIDFFSTDILKWDEKIQFILADEVIFSKNKYIDKDFLYCLIFSKTTNIENGEYLLQNFVAAFHGLNPNKCSLEFLENIEKNVIHFSTATFSQNHIFYKLHSEKLKQINI